MLQWFDTHCHLDMMPAELRLEDVIERARVAGIRKIVVPGVRGMPGNIAALANFAEVLPAWGIHPDFITATSVDTADMKPWSNIGCEPVAIGECGLDRRITVSLPRQTEIFLWHLQLARKNVLPLIVHLVGHYQQAFEMLVEACPLRPWVMHSWSGSAEMAARFVERGAFISLSGGSLRNKLKLEKLLAKVPVSSLLVESDAPDMCPPFWHGKYNEPVVVAAIGREIANILGMDIEKFAKILYTNSLKIFYTPERNLNGQQISSH